MEEVFDVVVIGAGVVGSSTGYHLAKQGRRVLLLDQVRLCHAHCSVILSVHRAHWSAMLIVHKHAIVRWRVCTSRPQYINVSRDLQFPK